MLLTNPFHFLRRFGLTLILFSTVFASTAHADESCAAAFDASGKIISSSEVCQDDVLLNSTSVFLSDLINSNEKVRSIYQNIIGDEPLVMSRTVKTLSKMISELMVVASFIALVLLVCAVVWRIGNMGMAVMREKELQLDLSDLWLLGATALVLPFYDGISASVVLALAALLVVLKISAWLSALFLPMILPESEVDDSVLDLEYHQTRSVALAKSLVVGLSTAQDSSTYASALSVLPEHATMVDGDASEAEGITGAVWRFFARETRDPSFQEFYHGIFTDHSLALSIAGAQTGGSTSTNLELFSGKPSGQHSIKAPLFLQDFGVSEVFEQSNVMSITGADLSADRKLVETVATSIQISKMAEVLVAPEASNTQLQRNAKIIGDAMLTLIRETVIEHPKAEPSQIIRIATGLLDGTYSVRASQNNLPHLTYRFTPFAIPYKPEEPLFNLLTLANQTVKAGRMVSCVKNLDKAGTEIGAFYQIVHDGKTPFSKFKSLSAQPFGHPVCVYPTNSGGVELLLSRDSQKKAFDIYKHTVSGATATPLANHLGDLKRELEQSGEKPEIVALTEDVQAHFKTLVDYFNVLGAGSRYAAAKYIGEADSKANLAADQELREKGAVGLMLSFMSSAHRSMAFADAIRASELQTTIFVGKEDKTGWLPRKVVETATDAQNAAIPVNKDLPTILTGSAGQVARVSANDESVTGDAWAEFLVQGVELLIPRSDLLSERLGLGDNGLGAGLMGCSGANTCINFSGHPVHAIISFSSSIFEGGVLVLIIDSVVQNLNSYLQSMTGGSSAETDGVITQAKSYAMKIASKLAAPLKIVAGLMFVVAMVSAVLAKLALGGVFAGAIGAILMPLKIVFSAIAPILKALIDIVALLVLLPVLLAASIVKFDKEPIISSFSILKLTLGGLLALPLITISFVVFIVLSYVGVFLTNSLVGVIMLGAANTNSGTITVALFGILTIVAWLALVLYVIFTSLRISLTVVPKVQDMLGINSALGQVKEDLNNVFAAGMILAKTKEVKEKSSRMTENKIQKEQFEDMAAQAGKGMGMSINNQGMPEAEAAQTVNQEGSKSAVSQPVVETSMHKEVKANTNGNGYSESTQPAEGLPKGESPSGESNQRR
ncbi:hypothetical protein [Salinivibrio sp. SS2]|uniref:hypothetical protein n=1 Tax=Salinivibrio sp. SS2 TaxID=1892894 RepID=UPI00084C1958|nr:hypothetical protein [Salinivibrio sp. DV]ODQ00619.1 hypothetical protein BGK46_06100 [Salinivibrio sp. DV]